MSFEFKVKDVDDKFSTNKIEVNKTEDYATQNYLFSVHEEDNYYGYVGIYLSLKQLERFSDKLSKFVEKELAKKEREKP